jgi:hypothetical protein
MQIRVNVELQGEPEEVGLLLAQLGETMLISDEADDEGLEDDEEEDPQWWTPERAEAFVTELTDPAVQALSVIAAHAPRLGFRELQRRMGMTGPQLAGRLSSIGFTVARQGAPLPFVRDHYQKVYMIDEKVAALMRDATANEMTRRRDQPARGRPTPQSG